MSFKFYPLKVKEIRQETPECVSVAFDVPQEYASNFKFEPGQHLIFKKELKGEEQRRTYSICSTPDENELRIAVKQLPGGLFSSFIHNDLKVGDVIDTMQPKGSFVNHTQKSQKSNYLFIAAGSGITPTISLIKSILINEPSSTVSLLYGNKSRASIIFKTDLENLKNKHINRFSIFHILSRETADAPLLDGRIDHDKIKKILSTVIPKDVVNKVFICGPEEMILSSRDTLKELGFEENQYQFELFHSDLGAKSQEKRKSVPIENDNVSKVQITIDGMTSTIHLGYNGESILDAALKAGADLPFACKGGVCSTCKCKVESGEVSMDINYALEKDELKRGFVLACQSHPKSEKVIINFDAR